VATFGLGTRMRISPTLGSSLPPLRKNVTCAYFSVSAIWIWRSPASAKTSANVQHGIPFVKATEASIVGSYSVRHTNRVSGLLALSNPEKPSSVKALVSCRALSGRKLKKMTASPSWIVARGRSPSHTTTGTTNSSVTPSAYDLSIAPTASWARTPSPSIMARHDCSTLSQRPSRSIA